MESERTTLKDIIFQYIQHDNIYNILLIAPTPPTPCTVNLPHIFRPTPFIYTLIYPNSISSISFLASNHFQHSTVDCTLQFACKYVHG